MRTRLLILIFTLWIGRSFAQTNLSNIEEASAQSTLSCPEPTTIPGCSGVCWKWQHDLGTNGSSCGNSSSVTSPSRDGHARRFDVSWSGYGGERFSIKLGTLDSTSDHFVLDLWFYVTDLTHVRNLEFDLNQVLANGETVIFGTQCNLTKGLWQYTTKVAGAPLWNDSKVVCERRSVTANAWHHLVLSFYRDTNGVVTYDSVSLDDFLQSLRVASGPSNFALNWKPPGGLVANFQIDGDDTAGSTTAYLDSMSVIGTGFEAPAPPTNLKAIVN